MIVGAERKPKTVYLVKINFFAGIEMTGEYKADSIMELMEHPDIRGKLAVTDSIKIDRIGISTETINEGEVVEWENQND